MLRTLSCAFAAACALAFAPPAAAEVASWSCEAAAEGVSMRFRLVADFDRATVTATWREGEGRPGGQAAATDFATGDIGPPITASRLIVGTFGADPAQFTSYAVLFDPEEQSSLIVEFSRNARADSTAAGRCTRE